jgi:hypothetical protein
MGTERIGTGKSACGKVFSTAPRRSGRMKGNPISCPTPRWHHGRGAYFRKKDLRRVWSESV